MVLKRYKGFLRGAAYITCICQVLSHVPDRCAHVDGHPAAKRRLLKRHTDARQPAPDRIFLPMAAESSHESKSATPAQILTASALDWSPGDTFDDTPGMPRHSLSHARTVTDANLERQGERQP